MIAVMSEVKFTAVFSDSTGTLGDPTTVTFRIKSPTTGVETLYTYGIDSQLVRSSVGSYSVLYVPNAAGTWLVRWRGTGGVNAASLDIPVPVVATQLTP
jgi:hypothetical protein